MEIKKLNFEKREVQIKETYIDEFGRISEQVKKVMLPTGKIIEGNEGIPVSDKKRGPAM